MYTFPRSRTIIKADKTYLGHFVFVCFLVAVQLLSQVPVEEGRVTVLPEISNQFSVKTNIIRLFLRDIIDISFYIKMLGHGT